MFKRMKQVVSAAMAVSLAAVSLCSAVPAAADTTDPNMPDFSYIGALGTLTADQTANIAGQIYTALKKHEASASVTCTNLRNNTSIVSDIYFEVVQNTDAGLLVNGHSLSGGSVSGNTVTFPITYLITDNTEYKTELKFANEKIDSILANVDPNWKDYEKALYLHDYLAAYCDYDYTTYSDSDEEYLKHTTYGMLKRDKAVCDGYASLYSVLLNRLGMQSTKVTSSALGHAWNLIKVDGSWYHVDVTHDDVFHNNHPGIVLHDNFIKTSDEMYNGSSHAATDYSLIYGGDVYSKASTNAVTNNIWDGSKSDFQPIKINDENSEVIWARAYSTGGTNLTIDICDMDSINSEPTVIKKLYEDNYPWLVPGSNYPRSYSYKPGEYSALYVKDNVLFFTKSNNVLAYYNGKTYENIMNSVSNSEGCIYGLKEKDGYLYYYFSDSYNTTSTENKINTSIANIVADVKAANGTGTITYAPGVEGFTEESDMAYHTWKMPDALTNGYETTVYSDEEKTKQMTEGELILEDTTLYNVSEKIEVPEPDPVCEFAGGNAELSDVIRLNLYMRIDDKIITAEDGKVVVSFKNETHEIPFSSLTKQAENSNVYLAYTAEFYAREINEDITIQPYYNGAYGTEANYSVNDYLETAANSSDTDVQKAHNVVEATQAYGLCANMYFHSDVDVLSDLSDTQKDDIQSTTIPQTEDGDSYKSSKGGALPDGVAYVHSTLILSNEISVRHYFTVPEGANLKKLCTATVSGVDGASCSIVKKTNMENTYYVQISGIKTADLGKMIEMKIQSKSDENVVYTINYSPMCYAYSMSNNESADNSIKYLVKALYLYYKEAVTYANANA